MELSGALHDHEVHASRAWPRGTRSLMFIPVAILSHVVRLHTYLQSLDAALEELNY